MLLSGLNRFPRQHPRIHRSRSHRLTVEQLEDRTLPSGNTTLGTALSITPGTPVIDSIAAPPMAFYSLTLPQSGLLVASVHATSGLQPRLSLLGPNPTNSVLVTSDGEAGNPDDLLAQSLPAGTYYLEVQGLQGSTGSFTLTTQLNAGPLPSQPMPLGGTPGSIAVGDINGDGKPDLVLSYRYSGSNTVSVLLGNGDGSYQAPQNFPTGSLTNVAAVAIADISGDGKPDIVIASNSPNTLTIFPGNGDGTFGTPITTPVAYSFSATDFALADVNGNGKADLVTTGGVELGNGDGSFQPLLPFPGGFNGNTVMVADVNGDGRPDVIADSSGPRYTQTHTLSVLLGNGDGTFQAPNTFPSPISLGGSLTAADVNGDGRADLVGTVSLYGNSGLVVQLGNGDGTFQAPRTTPLAFLLGDLAAADVNNDGRIDLIGGSFNGLAVQLGNGDGSFQTAQAANLGGSPTSLAAADLNHDGNLDIISSNGTVLLGNGDASFQSPLTAPGGGTYTTVADVNGDGRPDLVFDNPGPYIRGGSAATVSVLLGNGDGSFQAPRTYAAGNTPPVVADINGDGKPDIITAHSFPNAVSVLLGNGDGTFQSQLFIPLSAPATALAVTDVTGNGLPDIVLATFTGIAVLLNNGNDTFQAPLVTPLPFAPGSSLLIGDFNGDGHADVAVSEPGHGVDVLLGDGSGTFQAQFYSVSAGSLVEGDFNGDGKTDLATLAPGAASGTITVLLNNGNGTFTPLTPFTVNGRPSSLVAGDFNGDGFSDLAIGNAKDTLALFLSNGDGTFTAFSGLPQSVPATPQLAFFSNSVGPDSLILRDDGTILYRRGIPAEPGTFAPPVPVNPSSVPARDFTLVVSNQGTLVAALDRVGGKISLYAFDSGTETFHAFGTLSLTAQDIYPTHILAANLTGNPAGQASDLIVYNASSSTVTIFLSSGAGGFLAPQSVFAGFGGSSLATAPGPLGLDILISNQTTGAVTDLINDGTGHFSATAIAQFRAAPGPFNYDTSINPAQAQSLQRTVALTLGNFLNNGQTTIVAVNAGGNDFTLLSGNAAGSYLNPVLHLLPFSPGAVASGDFNHDGKLDLAILDPEDDRVYIYLGDGAGHFAFDGFYAAGNNPTGITVADVTRPGGGAPDGTLDLLIGNSYGDILVLPGNGDGTFAPYERVENGIPLAVVSLQGQGQDDFIFANQGFDHVTVEYGSTAPLTTLANAQSAQPVLGPGAVTVADLNGDGISDLIVANSGSNDVLVFLGNADGTFQAAQSFFAGDNPVGITVAFLKGASAPPDLVIANEGSNDVSILYGSGSGTSWTMTYGPRLDSGGIGPVSTVAQDVNGDGVPDILASNSSSNNVGLLLGTGQGLFNDTNVTLFATGLRPGQIVAVTTATGPGFVVLNTGGNTLTELSGFNGGNFTTTRTINAGGLNPVAVVAVNLDVPGLTLGLTDLIIADANTDDLFNLATGDNTGNLAFLVGDDTGFTDAETFTDPEMPNPSAVALSAINGDSVFYATTEGVEHAFRFEIGTSVTQQTPLEGSPGSLAPVLTQAGAVEALSETQVNPDLLFLRGVELPAIEALNAAEAASLFQQPTALGSFDLLAFAEGGKGDSTDAWRHLVEGWEQAQSTWGAVIQQSASDGWALAVNVVRDATDGTEALVGPFLRFTGADGLGLPDMQWRVIGKQMWQVSYGAVETTWTATALAEMRDHFQVAFQEALTPWLPALPEIQAPNNVPALEGGQEALRGLTEVLRSAAPSTHETPWQQTVDTVSRSLLEATGVVPVRPLSPQPAPKVNEPVLLAGGVEEGAPVVPQVDRLAPVVLPDRKGTTFSVLYDSAYQEEREAFWLALAAVAILPLYGRWEAAAFSADEEPERRRLGKSSEV